MQGGVTFCAYRDGHEGCTAASPVGLLVRWQNSPRTQHGCEVRMRMLC